ncbi:hypothetical protein BSKO_09273 [Bryopsis sp. KO-2023]|nr:hypothetical protein BSKO_09273 [Bryopsis sp. KO-2023]
MAARGVCFLLNSFVARPSLRRLKRWGPPSGDAHRKRSFGSFSPRLANVARAGRDMIVEAPDNAIYANTKEDENYWIEVMNNLKDSRAKALSAYLDTTCVLGVGDWRRWAPRKEPTAYKTFQAVKSRYPRHIVLVKVGTFYEAVGFDAIMLVELEGLNPMGVGAGVPRAGCQVTTIRRNLKTLTDNHLSVVVCEEVNQPRSSYKNTKAKKQRFISQIVTPQNPNYMYGLVDEGLDIDFSAERRPLVAVSWTSSGFTTMEYQTEPDAIYVSENLTEEAVWSQLYRCGVCPPLFLHESAHGNVALDDWKAKIRKIAPSILGDVRVYRSEDPAQGFNQQLVRHLGWDYPKAKVKLRSNDPSGIQQSPPPFTTMQAIGLASAFGSCPLVESLVPERTPRLARNWLTDILTTPPPPEIVFHIHNSTRAFMETMQPLPKFRADMHPRKIARVIECSEGSDTFFRNLHDLLSGVRIMLGDGYENIYEHLVPLASFSSSLAADRDSIMKACSTVTKAISKVVAPAGEFGKTWTIKSDSDENEEEDFQKEGTDIEAALESFLESTQCGLKNRIHPHLLQKEFQKIEAAEKKLRKCVETLHGAITSQVEVRLPEKEGKEALSKYLKVVHENIDRAIAFKIGKPVLRALDNKSLGLLHPNDRHAAQKKTVYSTENLEKAQVQYRQACDSAEASICEILQDLCDQVHVFLADMCVASSFAIVTMSVTAHVESAIQKQWILPDIRRALSGESGDITLEDIWPYWMPLGQGTITNSVELREMILLTGCNMGGKSTLIRSIGSICLLASCGLTVPAKSASLPFLDAIIVRTFLGDGPMEGKSGFAVEMHHMGTVLNTATKNTLVLVDELGKGTEVKAGASLAGSVLKGLSRIGCVGVFATHLHHLVDLFETSEWMVRCMRIGAVEGSELASNLKLSRKLVDGHSRSSSGFHVACDRGVPKRLVQRALDLRESLSIHVQSTGERT